MAYTVTHFKLTHMLEKSGKVLHQSEVCLPELHDSSKEVQIIVFVATFQKNWQGVVIKWWRGYDDFYLKYIFFFDANKNGVI